MARCSNPCCVPLSCCCCASWGFAIAVGTNPVAATAQAQGRYVLVPDAGLREAHGQDRAALAGAQWQAIEEALSAANAYPAVLRACVLCAGELKVQLRTLLQHHCGQPVLRTRQLMMDIQSL